MTTLWDKLPNEQKIALAEWYEQQYGKKFIPPVKEEYAEKEVCASLDS